MPPSWEGCAKNYSNLKEVQLRDVKRQILNEIAEHLDTARPEALYYLWTFLMEQFFFSSSAHLSWNSITCTHKSPGWINFSPHFDACGSHYRLLKPNSHSQSPLPCPYPSPDSLVTRGHHETQFWPMRHTQKSTRGILGNILFSV